MKLELDVRKKLQGFELAVGLSSSADVLALFGPSGAGKSVLLRMLAGILHPDSGRIVLDGELLYDSREGVRLPPQRRRLGYVPQTYALFPHLTVAQNVMFGVRADGSEAGPEELTRILGAMRLEGFANRAASQLSGGQQQRVALARALMVRPRAMLLDEPFSAMEDELREALRTDLLAVRAEFGIGILAVTHNLADIAALGGSVAVLDSGELLQIGEQEDVFRHPASERVARLTGARNLLSVAVRARDAGGSTLLLGGAELRGPCVPDGLTEVRVAVRAEAIRLLARGESASPDESVVPVRLLGSVPTGPGQQVEIRLGDGDGAVTLRVIVSGWWWERHSPETGSACRLAIPAGAVHVLPRPGTL